MVLLRERTGSLCARQPSLLNRAGVRMRSLRLTTRLAGGAAPESTMLLALRAQQLVAMTHREALATELAVLVEAATGPARSRRCGWPVNWAAVAFAADELQGLAERLSRPGPVGARGVALTYLLLRDGAGPLYYPDGWTELVAEARAATAALEPQPTL